MPEGRIMKVVLPLMAQLSEARSLATRCKEAASPSSSAIDEFFKKIEGEIMFIKEGMLRVERWERYVEGKFGDIAKNLDEYIMEQSRNMDQFRTTLQDMISQGVSYLKEEVTPVMKFLPAGSGAVSPQSLVISSSSTTTTNYEYPQDNDIVMNMIRRDPVNIRDNIQMKYDSLHTLRVRELLELLLIFPLNSEINKTILMNWWRAGLDDQIENFLRELIMLGFITPIYRDHKPWKFESFRVHPYVHCILRKYGYKYESYLPSSLRRCGISGQLVLINLGQYNLKFKKDEVLRMRYAKGVHLGQWHNSAKYHIEVENTEFLEWLPHLKYVKYLSLRGISRIKELPPSIVRITELRCLDLRACHNLERLPIEITMLKRLIHLDVSGCYLLDHMPKGMSSLLELEVLKGFVIGNSTSENPCQLYGLSHLKKLRKLSIRIGRDFVVADGEFATLGELESLRSLTITWGGKMSHYNLQGPHPELDFTTVQVSPPPSLTKLDLRCFPQETVPNWLNPSKLSKLKYLYIRGGFMELRGLLGKEWLSVEILRLRFLGDLDVEKSELLDAFPFLDVLDVHECNSSTFTNRRFVYLRL